MTYISLIISKCVMMCIQSAQYYYDLLHLDFYLCEFSCFCQCIPFEVSNALTGMLFLVPILSNLHYFNT